MRTRFLPMLDDMLQTDRDGAIMDMLQVLIERGVIVQISAGVSFWPYPASDDEEAEGMRRYEQEYIALQLGRQISTESRSARSERVEPDGQGVIERNAFFVNDYVSAKRAALSRMRLAMGASKMKEGLA